MFLSENEIDLRLTELRRRRDLVEREIADLLLYRELGRRLAGSEPEEISDPDRISPPVEKSASRPCEVSEASASERSEDGLIPADVNRPRAGSIADSEIRRRPPPEHRSPPVPSVAFEEDPVAARRYGRAIMDAALEALRETGRPLHAGEILERVVARGLTVPGRDPVAGLNTRLWKRSGPGGPLRRLGDAVYDLAEPPVA